MLSLIINLLSQNGVKLKKNIQKAKLDGGQKEMADYIDGKLAKKGFVPIP